MQGALIVDKPSGPTSHDAVACARRALRVDRVGHTGTLDPLATGVLVLLLGKATRLAQFLVADEKEYVADVRLGIETASYDAATLPDPATAHDVALDRDAIDAALAPFCGTFLQTPPPFSAKKVGGTRAYALARRQEPVDLQPVEVTVRTLEMLSSPTDGVLRLRVVCSAGFYVRSLAHDIGRRLGCGAHLAGLRRVRAGRFSIDDAVSLETMTREPPAAAERVLPVQALLDHLPALTLSEEGTRRASHGNSLTSGHLAPGAAAGISAPRVRLLDPGGGLLAIADRGADALLHPIVVLV